MISAAVRCVASRAELLDPIRAIARRLGYTIAVHGSIARDLDLIAIPWDAECVEAADLAHAIARLVQAAQPKQPALLDGPRRKAHGRLAWGIALDLGAYIDLSVMPRHDAPHVAPDSPT